MMFKVALDEPNSIISYRIIDPDGKITKESILSALKPPYPLKYYLNIILFFIALTIFLLWNYGVIPGYQLGFFCNDPLFSHKYTGNTIPTLVLAGWLVSIVPFIYFLIEYNRQRRFKDIFSLQTLCEFIFYIKQLIIGLILVEGCTELAKTIVGEHRPHFFDTCRPDTNQNCTNGTYIPTFTCTNTDVAFLDLIDASRSFPSGHSSLSWFVALYTAYIVHSRLPVHTTGTAFKLLMFLLCLVTGLVCSLTRITDRRHHWWDVLIGTIIGVVGFAYMVRVTEQQIRILNKQSELDEQVNEDSIA